MGKQTGKKKKQVGAKSGDSNAKESKLGDNSPRVYDEDTVVFISMSRGLKDEGNKLFQKRDCEGAMLKYEKAIKLLPRNHIDVSYLRSNMAACYMQMGIGEYPRAIHECNLALEVTPKYSKALLKRARCYEALNRLDFALRDVNTVLNMEPNNVMATEIADRVKTTIEKKGVNANEVPIDLVPEYVEPPISLRKVEKENLEKLRRKKCKKFLEKGAEHETEEKKIEDRIEEKTNKRKAKDKDGETKAVEKTDEKKVEAKVKDTRAEEKADAKKVEDTRAEEKADAKKAEDTRKEEKADEKKAEDKLVVEEIISNVIEEEPKRSVKLVFGDDIRWVQLPFNCSILKLREVISDRFPSSKAVLIKYRDQEGDLVTITTNEELRWAEVSTEQQGSVRLHVVEVSPEQDPFYAKFKREYNGVTENGSTAKGKKTDTGSTCIDDWIIQFAELFKNYVGFNSDAYLDLHELGIKLYSEAMEETVTSEEAQDLFNTAGEKFQEMAALSLFNWGNVHMSRARKRVYFTEDASRESVLAQVKTAYDWAQKEYSKAGKRYEEALRIKADFYEGVLALGQQQFEQAKLSWYYAVGTNVDLETWPSAEVLQLYNSAEDNMERGMQMWEEAEEQRLTELSKPNNSKILMQKMGLDGFYKDISAEEATEQAANMRSQISLLWGTMLYERSIMEFKLGLPVWQECLEVAIEKFELSGASPTDIAVMIKNHCSNDSALEGLGFNIDEIVQAWNEMYEAKRWQSDVPSFRLEPLLRRRVSKLYHVLEHA
ncbi:HSP-interacting protein [Actinidia chinensis var. chinensis]|uniref:HSP-interacting protein n=1 Tax=Actinidia chinensis var. chinensis TaxID=1590841 RepID=A0A2R6QRZ9_ACTCC|nr:HSP-interacting protein [Actinidia chinensis var. chinensis]